jgi:DNA-binding GntR family transcriptional regulator
LDTSSNAVSTRDLIAGSLRADIVRGELRSEEPLRQDEIAARFGVSKIPVREALIQLEAEGLVTFYPNRGAVVSRLSPAEVDEIFVMRVALETTALRRAIPQLTIANLGQAEKILNAIDQEQDVARWSDLNWEFHATLYAPAGLPRVMGWVERLHIHVARYLVIYLAGMDYQTASQEEHRKILKACRYGDVEAATEQLGHHLQSASDHLVSFLEQRESVTS